MVSIKDIARIAGVSPATVSRAINDRKYVKPEIRERIFEVVRQTGYVPNRAARSMVLKRSFAVGIVIPDGFNIFQRQLFSIIERNLESEGYHTLFFFVKWESESELACLRRLKAEKLDGIIMMHEVGHPEFYTYLAQSAMPTIQCTFDRAGSKLHSIHVDEEAAARAAADHLISLGHRKIGLLSGTHFSFALQREAGYRAALSAHDIAWDENRVVRVPSYSPDDGRSGMLELLSRGLDLTALFAETDELAIGAIRALYETGRAVPADLSVAGFDDIDISAYLTPGLTTIKQPIEEMGAHTARIMSRLIAGERGLERVSTFGHKLVVRESTRALPEEG